MIHEEYFNHPFLKWFFKAMGFIPVSDPGTAKGLRDALKKARLTLKNGEVLCIFPEGKITRNGVMNKFQKGANFMIPPDMDVPVIPIYMANVWGSIFSYYSGKIQLRRPLELPYRISITVGKPIPKGSSPYMQRRIVSELAAEAGMQTGNYEKTLHYKFLKQAKKNPFKKVFFDYNKNNNVGIPNYQIMMKAMLLSKIIRNSSKQKYVGVMLPNTVNTSVVLLAVMLADKIPAVLNFSVSSDVLRKSMNKAQIDCVLTSRIFIKKAKIEQCSEMLYLEDIAPSITGMQKLMTFLKFTLIPSFILIKQLAPKTSKELYNEAVLLFSSGSTGDPKGVMLSHHNINCDVNSIIKVMAWDFKKDALLGNLPMFHSFGLTTLFWIPMMTGTKVVYTPNPLDANSAVSAIKKHKLTILLAIPSLLQAYMRKSTKNDFDSLRLLIVGAEKLRKDIADSFYEKNGKMPMEGYGCTEAAPIISINVPNDIQKLSNSIGKEGSAGLPMPGICVKIVDMETGEELSAEQPGMMYVKGQNIMLGYLNDEQKTLEVLKNKWYETGDIAKVDKDGYIFITGRVSRFSKIGGEMVPHEMIEEALNNLIKPDKLSLAVFGAPDPKKGEKLIVVYSDININPSEIIADLRKDGKLSALWIPKAENFLKIDDIPRLGAGKVNILKLKEVVKKLLENK
jgi:acyl-[acyl-carrier-protein]-phospholipid O-acyltransferase/long-chain-fatty-acid--[acyl-carrier-protein] ligase